MSAWDRRFDAGQDLVDAGTGLAAPACNIEGEGLMRKIGVIAAWVVGGLVLLVLAAFAALQTGPVKRLLAQNLTRMLTTPASGVQVGTISGVVPFNVSVSRIALTDPTGAWLVIDRAALRWSPSALLRGTALVDRLSARSIDVLRQPAAAPEAAKPSGTGFTLPRLPVAVDVRDLRIARLAVSPALAGGDHVAAAVTAQGLLADGRAAIMLSLARTDGQKGSGLIDARYDEPANSIALKIAIEEPTGFAMDAVTGRSDHLPLSVTLDGAGPLSGWAGQFRLASGAGIGADAAVQVAHAVGTRIAIAGSASFAPLLAEDARPMIGERVTFDVTGADDGKGGITLAPSEVALAAVTLKAQGSDSDSGALSGTMRVAVPNVSTVGALTGQNAAGAISIDAALSGTVDHPKLALTEQGAFTFGQITAEGLALTADVADLSGGDAKDPRFALTLDAKAADLRAAEEGGRSYGAFSLHLAGETDTGGKLVEVRTLTADGGGIAITGAGRFDNGEGDGKVTVVAADLAVLGRLLDRPLGGTLNADVTARRAPDQTVTAALKGSADRLKTGIAAADAVLAGPLRLSADIAGKPAAPITLSALSVSGARARLEAAGGFDPKDRAINGKLTAKLNNLNVLSPAVASNLGGSGDASAVVGGTLDAPTLDARATVDHLLFQTVRIDRLDARVLAPHGLAGAATIDAKIASGRLNETLAARVSRDERAYRLADLRLAGTGANITGNVVIVPSHQAVSGKLNGGVDDLSVWSGVVGAPLAGRLGLAVDFPPDGRQGPVRLTVDRLTYGTGAGAIGINHAMLTGSASGDFKRPAGTLDLALGGVVARGATVAEASAHVSAKGADEAFRLTATGHAQEAVALDLAGTAAQNRGTNMVRLSRMTAALGVNHLALTRPVALTVAPNSYSFEGLALDIDGGALAGNAALSPWAVTADLALRRLPLHPLALLAGMERVAGTLDGKITLAGTARAPDARLSLATTGLDLETDGPLPRPKLDVGADVHWRGQRADLNAQVSSTTGERLTLGGSVPFAVDLATFKTRAARDNTLALTVSGGGRLENLTSIVPLGEDRVTGAFTIAVSVGGTVAAPLPAGQIAIMGGSYSNMALGTELQGIDLAVNGAGERFVLDHLTATDGKSGTLNASGAVDLAAKPANVAVDLKFSDFLVAQTDDATVDADADLKVAGDLEAMKASGTITVRHADLYIPDRLPASVVKLNVIEIGGNRQETAASAQAPRAKPVAAVALQIALDAPGQIFVRGHGITSEWSSHVDIGGSSAAPVLLGQLTVVNGTIDLLGTTFTIDRGIVRLDGGTAIDPVLDVQASATASSVTATIDVTGTAAAPKIALSSVPVLPQDEVLAQILFGSNVSSLTASQGLQLAAAAASLAQGGPGVLDRLRNSIGLDVLSLGSSSTGGTQGAQGTTVTGGKYVAPGVLVGVQQGITSTSSQALVQVQITPHISVNSTFGAAAGSGFGAKYSIDY